jgi:DNA polymerase III alpha subunit
VPAELDSHARAELELWQRLVRVQNELRYLGLHVSSHPMALLRDEARRAGCLTSAEVAANSGGRVRFAGITSALRRVRQGSRFAEFVTFEDEFGLLEAVVSSSDYEDLARKVETPGPYLVEGLVRREAGCSWLEVNELVPFHQRPHPYAA